MYKTNGKKHHTSHFDLSSDLEKIKDVLAKTAKDVKGKTTEVFTQSVEDVKDKSCDIKDNMETYLSERPFKTLILGMLSGAFLGAFMRRKKRSNFRHRE